MKVKDIGRVAQKWATNAGSASGSYADGVNNPKADWAQATQAGAENWKQGVAKASTENRFAKGVAKAGTSKQQGNAISKGVGRYQQGVAIGQQDYSAAMEPVLRTLEATVLPPRGPKGDPKNLQRVGAVNNALHNAKVK